MELEFDIPFRVATDGTIVRRVTKYGEERKPKKGEYASYLFPSDRDYSVVPAKDFYGEEGNVWEPVTDPMEILRAIVKALTE